MGQNQQKLPLTSYTSELFLLLTNRVNTNRKNIRKSTISLVPQNQYTIKILQKIGRLFKIIIEVCNENILKVSNPIKCNQIIL